MRENADPNISSELAAWVGRTTRRTDTISHRMAASFGATLAPHLAAKAGAPLGIHWCLAPDIVEAQDLGTDGHPRTGIFLPAMPFSRRMWAGGELTWHGQFAVGDTVTKTSTIGDIAFKTGRTGRLAFLAVHHDYSVADRLILAERQDLVYRDQEDRGSRPAQPPSVPERSASGEHRDLTTDAMMLFRYSALTFNGHRIHYDRPYATDVEGYEGLVVHGPLQATLMINLGATLMGAAPRRFVYRGLSPLICGKDARIEADEPGREELSLRVVDATGTVTMTAKSNINVR